MTTKESFDVMNAVMAERCPYDFTLEEWKSATDQQKHDRYKQQSQWRDEHEARLVQAIRGIVPEVGLPCTIAYYSDYRAATVTRIISPNKIEVMHNETECIDYFAGDYKILPELAEHMGVDVFTKRRNGKWIAEGQPSKDGVRLLLHYQRHYIDPSF